MENGTESHGKHLISGKILIRRIIAQIIMMLVLSGTSIRFWENKWWINEIDPYRY